ncbi:MAG: preprotein translocase subunit SecD, partial [Halanaeroarchaeum sp.]
MSAFREYWRVTALVVLLLLSTFALFAPGMAPDDPAGEAEIQESGPTNLQYGLDLSGGARVRATVDGVTATGVTVETNAEASNLTTDLADELGVGLADVRVVQEERSVEAYGGVTESELETALEALGYEPDETREGVTEETRTDIVDTLNSKIDASGLSGAEAYTDRDPTGGASYVVIEAPNMKESEVRDLLTSRGVVSIVASYPENETQTNATVLTEDALREGVIGNAQTREGQHQVPVTLSDDVAAEFAADMTEYGFADEGAGGTCEVENGSVKTGSYCLLTMRDDEMVYSARVVEDLGESFANGEFEKDPTFVITATSYEEAQQLAIDLRAGSLPAPLTVQSTFSMDPSMASQYKLYSLVTGILAVFAVSAAVFFRYREPRIALPMIVTALSEVYLLLGFAASVGLALDLSHIAGLIAVVGTGVDDLVIIADEVMAEKV